MLVKDYWERMGQSYDTIVEILGAIEGLKLDFVQRRVIQYEAHKMQQNGDVWGTE